jgi:hypothetical protein
MTYVASLEAFVLPLNHTRMNGILRKIYSVRQTMGMLGGESNDMGGQCLLNVLIVFQLQPRLDKFQSSPISPEATDSQTFPEYCLTSIFISPRPNVFNRQKYHEPS